MKNVIKQSSAQRYSDYTPRDIMIKEYEAWYSKHLNVMSKDEVVKEIFKTIDVDEYFDRAICLDFLEDTETEKENLKYHFENECWHAALVQHWIDYLATDEELEPFAEHLILAPMFHDMAEMKGKTTEEIEKLVKLTGLV